MTSPFEKRDLIAAPTVYATQARVVRFQDVDAAGTIYFPRVLEYFGDTYMLFLTAAGLDVPRLLRTHELAAPLAHAEADFLSPLFFGDAVDVDIVEVKLGATSATFGHRIRKGDVVTSIGTTVHVFVDGGTFKPIAVPDGIRELAERCRKNSLLQR